MPRRPMRLVVAGCLGWLVFTVLAVVVSDDEFWRAVTAEASRALAAVFAALALGGGLLEAWERKQWRIRTQWVAVDMLDRTMRRAAGVAAAARAASRSTSDDPFAVALSDVLCFPWSAVKEGALLSDADDRSRSGILHALESWGAPVSGAGAPLERLAVTADALWDSARDLSEYLNDRHGPEVLSRVSVLHAKVRRVVDPTPGDEMPDALKNALAATAIGELLRSLQPIMVALDAAHAEVRLHLKDGVLIRQVEADLAMGREADARIKAWEHEVAEHRNAVASAIQAGADFQQTGQDLLRAIEDALQAPDTDQDTLDLLRDVLSEAKAVTADLSESLTPREAEEGSHGSS